jgi:hypothetical protein
VYKDVLLLAVRIARSKDRAYEATQQAFERCLRVRPQVESVEELSKYLKGAMRSALGHGYRETHRDYESAAATEQAFVCSPWRRCERSVTTSTLWSKSGCPVPRAPQSRCAPCQCAAGGSLGVAPRCLPHR